MALINCPECHREISDKAESCPHCGFPLVVELTQAVESGQQLQVKAKSGIADGVKIGAGMFIVLPLLIGAALVVIFLLLGMCTLIF